MSTEVKKIRIEKSSGALYGLGVLGAAISFVPTRTGCDPKKGSSISCQMAF